MAKPELAWKQMDVATLGAEAVALYEAKRQHDQVARQHREAFEKHVRALVAGNIPAGKRLAIGYSFGKFSVALADDDGKAKTTAKPVALTLTQALGL